MNRRGTNFTISLNEDAMKQMFFIYNAVKNGYTVRRINEDTIAFKKRDEEHRISVDDFVQENKKLDRILRWDRV